MLSSFSNNNDYHLLGRLHYHDVVTNKVAGDARQGGLGVPGSELETWRVWKSTGALEQSDLADPGTFAELS